MAVGCGDKTRSHVVAEQRKLRDVVPSLTISVPPVSLLFSEYRSVVWVPKGILGKSMLSCAPKSATLREGRGWSSHSVPVGPAKVTFPESHSLTSSTVSAAIESRRVRLALETTLMTY